MDPTRRHIGYRALATLALSFILAGGPAAHAQPLFDSFSPIEIELAGPVSATIEDRRERIERPFLLDAGDASQQVFVRLRGKSRSRDDVCSFPPLRLRFEAPTGVFAGQEKLKLVTHCRSGDRGDANVMEEFVAYRIFNLLSPVSIRVRPLHITYSDTDRRGEREASRHNGFFLEPAEQLAVRTGGELLELEGVALARLDPDQAALVYVFQYLIGNTDWSLVTADGSDFCCHNGLLLGIDGRIHYVPYDFDLSGLVNAPYAKPDPSLRLRNVRKRRYIGFCTEPETLQAAVRSIVQKENDIYTLVRTTPGLGEKQKSEAIDYLGQFFENARQEDKFLARLEKYCKIN